MLFDAYLTNSNKLVVWFCTRKRYAVCVIVNTGEIAGRTSIWQVNMHFKFVKRERESEYLSSKFKLQIQPVQSLVVVVNLNNQQLTIHSTSSLTGDKRMNKLRA